MNFFSHLGRTISERTPSLWLTPIYPSPLPRLSTTNNSNAGIDYVGGALLLNQW